VQGSPTPTFESQCVVHIDTCGVQRQFVAAVDMRAILLLSCCAVVGDVLAALWLAVSA
jgi:hypothetical protein